MPKAKRRSTRKYRKRVLFIAAKTFLARAKEDVQAASEIVADCKRILKRNRNT